MMSVFRVIGGLLVAAAGGIHLWLYFDFFHRVHVIGALFLVNAAVGLAVGAALLASASLLVLASGLAYSAGTLGAFFFSVYHGLFGYVERLSGSWQEAALAVELAAIVSLLAAATVDANRRGRSGVRHLETTKGRPRRVTG
jgi:hypothetical protein